ncbi:hypothetical protein AB0C88_09790 [Streptomyces chartreusis]|uniref:hypothetical protein n=1 Tax=Streptomyces chartreusis TaxID=1969 RepID=UPI003400E909
MFHSKRDADADVQRGHRLMDSVDNVARSEADSGASRPSEFVNVVTQGLFGQGERNYPPAGHSYPSK